jgi:hypothetical protein
MQLEEQAEKKVTLKQAAASAVPSQKEVEERRRKSEIVNTVLPERLISAGLRKLDDFNMSSFRILTSGAGTDVEKFIDEAVKVSAELQRLSTVKCGDRMLELQGQGWWQSKSQPWFWFPSAIESEK